MHRIGPLIVLEGKNDSKVPYSRSLYLDCSEKVLIDSGAQRKQLVNIDHEFGIELIINTHYHPDHIRNNHVFSNIPKWMNPLEYEMSRSIEKIAMANGVFQEWGPIGVEAWKQTMPQELIENLDGISGSYKYESEYQFGDVKVIFLHTPGHTSGLACPYFPELGVVFTVDYDMTSFGPWYNGTDGNIEEFIASGKRLLTLDADTYITGHQKGIFTKQEFKQAMDSFLAIIDKRDELIAKYVKEGLTFKELTSIGIFYPKKHLENPILQTWERSGIRKHLKRLGLSVPEDSADLLKAK